MVKRGYLWGFLKGSRGVYVAAMLLIGGAAFFGFINPLIISFAVDNVMMGKSVSIPVFTTQLDSFAASGYSITFKLALCAAALMAATVCGGVFSFTAGRASAKASEETAERLKNRLYSHIMELPYSFHVGSRTGDLVQRCTSDVETIRKFLAMQLVELSRAVFMISIALPIMFSLSVRLFIVAVPIIPIAVISSLVFFRKVSKAFQASDEMEGRLSTVLQENLAGNKVVKAFAREREEIEKFDVINRQYRKLTFRVIKLMAGYWSLSDFISLLEICAIVCFSGLWAVQGHITVGILLVFLSYEWMLLWPVRQMGRILADLGKALVSAGRIGEILDESPEAVEPHESTPEIMGGIEFRNVSFSYEEGKPVLSNIDFTVRPGQKIAILGMTGSGKTTLVQLLARLHEPDSGEILFDGVRSTGIQKKHLRSSIGFVLQEPFLYGKTVKQNIGAAKTGWDDAEIEHAAALASVHKDILAFSKGYDTQVGERGVTLSGGQKQRVAIARVLVKDYPILIFDDSLSAVDTETDERIRTALDSGNRTATVFMIAHRITTLMNADLILVMEDGRIADKGTHNELAGREGLYSRIWALQNSGGETSPSGE